MACEQYKKNLTDAALRALDPRRDAELRAHLAACEACRAALENEQLLLEAIDRGVAAAVAAKPSPEFAARVRQQIAALAAPSHGWLTGTPWLRWAPAAGALAVALLVVVWLNRQTTTPLRGPQRIESAAVKRSAPAVTGKGASEGPARVDTLVSPPGSRMASARTGRQGSTVPAGIRPAAARAKQPEVLVPPGQDVAVLLLYDAIWKGRADGASLVAEHVSFSPNELKIAPIEIAPLEVEPKSATKE